MLVTRGLQIEDGLAMVGRWRQVWSNFSALPTSILSKKSSAFVSSSGSTNLSSGRAFRLNRKIEAKSGF